MCFTRQTKKKPTLALAVLLVSSAAQAGAVVYVDGNAPPLGDGTTWNTAYRFLQDALADAAGGGVVEIHVASGTYQPDRDEANPDGTGDRGATFQLLDGVALMGGYAGLGNENPDERNLELFETILSGDLLGDDPPNGGSNAENSYNVTTASGTDQFAVLEGFTIKAGNANGPDPGPAKWVSGAGMWNETGSPTIRYCRFEGNHADAFGGGLNNRSDSNATVSNCWFVGNSSGKQGGGMANGLSSNTTVVNCVFDGNQVETFTGGGLYSDTSTHMTVANCRFVGNSAGSKGGGLAAHFGSVTVTNCLFVGNTAPSLGGAMRFVSADATVSNCTFSMNAAPNGNTLAFDFAASNLTMTNCVLWDGGDQISNTNGSTITMSYSDVQGGWPGDGNINANPLFVDPGNGDFRLSPGSPCIDAGNNAAVPLDELDLDDDGNTTEPIPYDLDGNPRFVNDQCTTDTGVGDPDVVDMGAYEFQGCCVGDLTGDGSVGINDFLILLSDWGPCGDCGNCPAGFDGDCIVGITDFLILLAHWGPCP
jgi:hypothetical protein